MTTTRPCASSWRRARARRTGRRTRSTHQGAAICVALCVLCLTDASQPLNAAEHSTGYPDDPAIINRPPRVGWWVGVPKLLVCSDSNVSLEAASRAVDFWRGHGFDIGPVRFHNDPLGMCQSPHPYGHIVIRAASPDETAEMTSSTLAETHFFITHSGQVIEYAKVLLVTDLLPGVLEHELGHSLGFHHYNKPGHLMHAKQTRSGWDDHGLEPRTPDPPGWRGDLPDAGPVSNAVSADLTGEVP